MIPAEFDYVAPESLEDAIKALVDGGEDAKLLAGGHSLIPLMKLRLAAPSLLVDLRKVPGLHGVERQNGDWRIGALTTHAVLEHAPELGVVSDVAATIADPQVRHRGTIGGSLAHGDSASDLPAAMLICEAEVTLQGRAGQRTVAAADLFEDYLTTAVGRRRGADRDPGAGARRLRPRVPEVHAAGRGLGDGRGLRRRQGRPTASSPTPASG